MTNSQVTLDHGERFSSLTVLAKLPGGRYRVACVCGSKRDHYRANALMRGRVKKCSRCRKADKSE